ncbi:MAG: NTP transferase domain-containing protein [Ignavibacteria bacterium]|nr:NTP transferase domain-containing protein [Ignavibacteria bacterium]MCC7158080.1 NTP transferase domain-containing protein [Ignavibacteria bacterium]
MKDKTKVVVLAGGNSNRFGSPKPFLLYDTNTTFLERIVKVYLDFGCREIILVLNQDHIEQFSTTFTEHFRSKIRVVYNSFPELGRFYSLRLGTNAITNCDYCFIQNIDNPFTDIATLKILNDNRKDDSYISPVYLNKGGHPILLSAMIIDMIKKETDIRLNTKDFLRRFKKVTVEVENEKILANINIPRDYKIFFSQLA